MATTEERLAEALGPDVDRLKIREDALKIMEQGVIVQLHIGRWRAKKSLSLDELGIEPANAEEQKALAELFELGQKRLLPADWLSVLDTLESTSRKILDKYSFKTAWGTFVPFTAYAVVKGQLDEKRSQYMALRDRIYSEYAVLTARVRQEYEVASVGVYRRITKSSDLPPAEFTESFVNAIMVCVPSAEYIRESFEFDVKLSYIPLVSADHLSLQPMYRAAERIEKTATVQARERQLRAMERDIAEQVTIDKERYLDGFMESLSGQLRKTILEAVSNVRDSMARNGKLGWKNVEQLRNVLAQVEALNFTCDGDITAQLAALKAALPVDERSADCDADQLGRVLRDITASTQASILALGDDLRAGRRHADTEVAVGNETAWRRGRRKADDLEDLTGFESKRRRVRLRDFLPEKVA